MNFNENFRKDVAYDNVKSHTKSGFDSLSSSLEEKPQGGGGMEIKLTSLQSLFRVKFIVDGKVPTTSSVIHKLKRMNYLLFLIASKV